MHIKAGAELGITAKRWPAPGFSNYTRTHGCLWGVEARIAQGLCSWVAQLKTVEPWAPASASALSWAPIHPQVGGTTVGRLLRMQDTRLHRALGTLPFRSCEMPRLAKAKVGRIPRQSRGALGRLPCAKRTSRSVLQILPRAFFPSRGTRLVTSRWRSLE